MWHHRKITRNPTDLQGLWYLMERHLQYIRFRKHKIHSSDSQRLVHTDLCEWTKNLVTFAVNPGHVGQVTPASLGCGHICKVTQRQQARPGSQGHRYSTDCRPIPTGHDKILATWGHPSSNPQNSLRKATPQIIWGGLKRPSVVVQSKISVLSLRENVGNCLFL